MRLISLLYIFIVLIYASVVAQPTTISLPIRAIMQPIYEQGVYLTELDEYVDKNLGRNEDVIISIREDVVKVNNGITVLVITPDNIENINNNLIISGTGSYINSSGNKTPPAQFTIAFIKSKTKDESDIFIKFRDFSDTRKLYFKYLVKEYLPD